MDEWSATSIHGLASGRSLAWAPTRTGATRWGVLNSLSPRVVGLVKDHSGSSAVLVPHTPYCSLEASARSATRHATLTGQEEAATNPDLHPEGGVSWPPSYPRAHSLMPARTLARNDPSHHLAGPFGPQTYVPSAFTPYYTHSCGCTQTSWPRLSPILSRRSSQVLEEWRRSCSSVVYQVAGILVGLEDS